MKKILFLIVLLNCLIQAQNISQIEYYIDSDPGYGLAEQVPLSASSNLTLTFSVDISSVNFGFHTLFVRGKTDSAKWSISYSHPFYKANLTSPALNVISYLEYFIDSDPGLTNAKAINIVSSGDVTSNTSIDLTNVPSGFHTLYLRSKDSKNSWAQLTHPFFKINSLPGPVDAKITKAEYFIDSDPGLLLGKPISIAVDSNLSQNFSIDLTSYSPGFHTLYLRARDENKKWTELAYPFFKSTVISSPNKLITMAEYFVDSDPGLGQGINMAISSATDIVQTSAIPLSSYPDGFHTLYLRAKDENKNWSQYGHPFFKTKQTFLSADKLARIEYFIDSDPGINLATALSLDNDSNTTADFSVDLTSVSSGFHTLFLRSIDQKHKVTQYAYNFIKKSDVVNQQNDIVKLEYYYSKTGFKSSLFKTNLNISSPDLTTDLYAKLNGLTVDSTYNMHLVGIDNKGVRSLANVYNFKALNRANKNPILKQSLPDFAFNEDFLQEELFSFKDFFTDSDVVHGDRISYTLDYDLSKITLFYSNDSLKAKSKANIFGNFKIVVTAMDTLFAAVSDTFYVNINNINDVPSITQHLANQNVLEDFSTFNIGSLNSFFTDFDGESLNYSINILSGSENVTVQLINSTELEFSSIANKNGNALVEISASDLVSSAKDTFQMSVEFVNDVPIFTSSPITSVNEGSLYSYNITATDQEKDGLSFSVSNLPTWLQLDTINNQVFGIPLQVNVGNNSVKIKVTDGLAVDSQMFVINVVDINNSPTLKTPFANLNTDEDFIMLDSVILSNHFSDLDNDQLNFTYNVLLGTTLVNLNLAEQRLAITSQLNKFGLVRIEVVAADATLSVTDTFDLVVNSVNDKPIANTDAFTIKGSNYANLNVVTNDLDIENDTLIISEILNPIPHGIASISQTKKIINFKADQGFNGVSQFKYVISDGALLDTALVTLNIKENNILMLNVSVHQNPVLEKYSDLFLISDTTLTALPEAKWFNGNDSAQIDFAILATNVYKAPMIFNKNGVYNLRVSGNSVNGSSRVINKSYNTLIVDPASPSILFSLDAKSSINFAQGTLLKSSILMASQVLEKNETLYEYTGNLNNNSYGELKIKFNKNDYASLAQLNIFQEKDGIWQAINTSIDVKSENAIAKVKTFGKFKLALDLNKKENSLVPDNFSLGQNFPNPFNPTTTIKFDLASEVNVSLIIYNVLGQKIKTLVSGTLTAQSYSVTWDATDDSGSKVASGIYFYQLISPSLVQTKKMVLLK